MSEEVFTNKEQLCQRFWLSVKEQKFKAKKIEGGSIWHPPTPFKASGVKSIKNKPAHQFISFDVVDYYPSIIEELLNKALDFASLHTIITQEEREIILHAKRS